MSARKATLAERDRLRFLLRGRRFVKGSSIAMPHRMIRAVCQTFPGQFVSTQAGYCNWDEATDDEIENAIADLRSRVKHMNARADALEHRLHRRQAAPQDDMFGAVGRLLSRSE